ncbi:MAG TPA: maleylpyruvate isomerase N-terminal domain-containing protein [Aggregatilineales bacterium]|nr:maleylpyruvate isomerase N-terminal domain-containing protein [Aggregatilineales bacterium]
MTGPEELERRRHLLVQLDSQVKALVDTYRQLPDTSFPVYEGWSAQDVLAHLTFWHESFARNLTALATGAPPQPLKGKLHDLNQAGVESMRESSLDAIIRRLESAHQQIQAHILNPAVTIIPYRKGSRDLTPPDHLQLVADHIGKHLRDVISRGRG